MKIYKALCNIFDKKNPSVKVKAGGFISFEDEKRAEQALESGFIEEVTEVSEDEKVLVFEEEKKPVKRSTKKTPKK